MALYDNYNASNKPTYDQWTQYGSWQGDQFNGRQTDPGNRANYDNYVKMQDQWLAQGNKERFQNNLNIHGFVDPNQMWQNQQRSAEDERMANIGSALDAINNMFSNRNGLYNNFENATFDLNRKSLENSFDKNKLKAKFALARGGLSGGSVDTSVNSDLVEGLNKGIINARNYATNQANQFRSRDNQMRAQLSGLAMTGSVSPAQITGGVQLSSSPNASYAPGLNDAFRGIYDNVGGAMYALGADPTAPGFGDKSIRSGKGSSGMVFNT